MEIRISIQTMEPLAATARTESGGPLRFEGWLESLHVLSTLIRAEAGSAGGKLAAAEDQLTKENGHDGRAHEGEADGSLLRA